jgi:hypothetical protein
MIHIMAKPVVPRGLGPAGRELWKSTLQRWELDAHELAQLREIARTADLCERLAAVVARDEPSSTVAARHAIVELRQQRVTLARLIAALRLPGGLQQDADDAAMRARDQRRQLRGFYGIRGVVRDA